LLSNTAGQPVEEYIIRSSRSIALCQLIHGLPGTPRSIWTRDIEEDILPTCRELGIKVVAP